MILWETVDVSDYDRIARIIEYICCNFQTQPSLNELADLVGLSSFQFHKLFQRWAGTTPKNFIKILTLVEAGKLLRNGKSVMETSLDVGLSGPSRLHDLCVNLESATPGQIKSGGLGMNISYGIGDTPFGTIFLAQTERGICFMEFLMDSLNLDDYTKRLHHLWPQSKTERNDKIVQEWVVQIFQVSGKRKKSHISIFVKGSPFQLLVWRALLSVPCGSVVSYSELAGKIDKPGSSRAVGSALGNNPIAILIPCHRVIKATGKIGQYHWGVTRKIALLANETLPNAHE